jgi:hypothetical protein
MKRKITKAKIPPECCYDFVKEHIAKKDTPYLEKLRGINLLAEERLKRDRQRKK